MNMFKRFILELVIVIILLLFGFVTRDIQDTFLGVSQLQFIGCILFTYILLRTVIDLILITNKFKKTGEFRDYDESKARFYFENSVYGHTMIISFMLIFTEVLNVAFIGLTLIFGLLWILSTLSLLISEKNKVKSKKFVFNDDDTEELYNLFSFSFYSEIGFEFFKILTDNTFGILNNYNKENVIVMLDKFSKSNYLFLLPRSMFFGDVNLFCGIINSYLKRLDLNYQINVKDILERDSKKISNKRICYEDTLSNDLKIVDEILQKKKYRIISILVDDIDESYLCLSVVSNSVYKKLRKYEKMYLEK